MNRRTFEGHMDWEYQHPGPVDPTSPFGQLSRNAPRPTFDTPSRYGTYGTQTPNPFAATASNTSPSKQSLPMPPPNSSLFSPPQLPKQFSAPQFRNPAFTTPQKRVEELVSECSGAEDSPALTDVSEYPADTPDLDRSEDIAKMTVTPSRMSRSLVDKLILRTHAPGRGEVPRGRSDLYLRDKVRKRKRQQGDKDVGSVRPRLDHDSDDSDSDWPEDSSPVKHSRGKKRAEGGWFRNALTAIHDHPNVPAILAGYIHLAVWILLVSIGIYCLWAFISTFRSDIALASDKARAALLEQSRYCASQYASNSCTPKRSRPPALEEQCNEWETCMNQDADRVHQVQVSAKNVAEIVNEFAGVLSIKAYGLIVTLVVLCALTTNVFSNMSRTKFNHQPVGPAMPFPSQPVPAKLLAGDDSMTYCLPRTPGRVRAMFVTDDVTDTDASPSDIKAILPPQTPSRRSPSKGERGRSPTKLGRSPSKGY